MSTHESIPHLDEQRRAGIRRTAWIVGGIALAILVLFFLEKGIWH